MLEKYGISEYSTNRCLRRNAEDLEKLIKYMMENGMPLLRENRKGKKRLDSIFNASDKELKTKCGIDIKKMKKERKGMDR